MTDRVARRLAQDQNTTELLLVRHGETDWNAAGRIQGQTDIELNAVGLAQAQRLARALEAVTIDKVWCSDLLRTRQTVAPLLAQRGLTAVFDARLRERHFGRLQGLSREQIAERDPLAMANLEARDIHDDFDGGESLVTFHERCTRLLDTVVAQSPGQRVLIVAHGGVLDSLYRYAAGVSLQTRRAWGLRNAALNRLRVLPGQPPRFEILVWDDARHLHDAQDEY